MTVGSSVTPTAGRYELTDVQRQAVETRGAAGGVVAYIQRLADGHRFTFYEDRVNGGIGPGVCSCGAMGCHNQYLALYRSEMIASYEAKVQDLAAETLRASVLMAVVRRLYQALGVAWRDSGFTESDALRFYVDGFPEGERAALLGALRDVDSEWISGDLS